MSGFLIEENPSRTLFLLIDQYKTLAVLIDQYKTLAVP